MRSRRRSCRRSRRRRTSRRKYRGESRVIVRVAGDGNCLFRALAYPSTQHAKLRQRLVDHVSRNWDGYYESFMEEDDRGDYITRMRRNGTWGDELMLSAFAEVYECTVIVYKPDAQTVISQYGDCGERVRRVSFSGAHYDAIV